MEVKNQNKNIETYDTPIVFKKIKGISQAKTYLGWLEGRTNIFQKRENLEMVNILKTCKEVYRKFYPINKTRVPLKEFKGISGIQVIKLPNCFETIQFRKTDKGIKEIRHKTALEDLNPLISVLRGVESNKKYKTRYIAQEYVKCAGIEENTKGRKLFDETGWNFEMFFGDRKLYCKFNLCLKILEYYGFIAYYKNGEVERLKDKFEVQGEFP